MASNNTISWSTTYDSILTYFRREHGFAMFASQIHPVHVSMPQWSMSIFLLKSDGGTPQNIRFNVFVILICSIYGENNIWHVKFWCFTLAVEVVSQTALYHAGSLVVSNFAYLGWFMQGRQGQTVPESPRAVHGPWHGLLLSKLIWLICTKLVRMWNRLGIPRHVCLSH